MMDGHYGYDLTEKEMNNYDIIIKQIVSGYGHTDYEISKNTPDLTNLQLALICDRGSLCFGYRRSRMFPNGVCVYTD